jgi:putative endonuclease
MRDHVYWVYILASRRNGTLYTGVTSDLTGRVQAHREGLIPGFTKKYGVKLLVYYELHHDINVAILREKRIKRWQRCGSTRWTCEVAGSWRSIYESSSTRSTMATCERFSNDEYAMACWVD